MKTDAQILREARALIEDPVHWCQTAEARTKSGYPVNPLCREATQWCASGAIFRVAECDLTHPTHRILCKAMGVKWVADFNDRRSHFDVLTAFDRAIELAEQAERP